MMKYFILTNKQHQDRIIVLVAPTVSRGNKEYTKININLQLYFKCHEAEIYDALTHSRNLACLP